MIGGTFLRIGTSYTSGNWMNILGISCWYHDAAACLVQDGRIVAAAQEERFTRKKHDPDFSHSLGLLYSAFTRLSEDEIISGTATLLAEGKVVGWFNGRMEFGPRALGSRSILADSRGREVQRTVNLKIKFRESFRPFAPSVTKERASEFFELDVESPYMLLVAPVRDVHIDGHGLDRLDGIQGKPSAVTHVDGTARIQTAVEIASQYGLD